MKKVAILGATGPTGKHLVAELSARGAAVRAVSRSESRLAQAFPDPAVERVAADILQPEQAKRAVAGADLVFHCLGFPMDRIGDHPVAARNLADALESGMRCVHVSSYWAYIPIRTLPVTEEHPRADGNTVVRMRRQAEDILQHAGAAVVNLPDFYGPQVHTSTVQRALEQAVAGKPVQWVGSPGVGREYVFVPDAMKAVAELAKRSEAYGERWIVPGAGPISFDEIAQIVEQHLGRPVRLRAAGQLALRLAGFFLRDVRAFLPMAPTYIAPIHFDGSKLRQLLGEIPVTPYAEAIPRTLDWLSLRVPALHSQ
jgi:nucleoside-diphosphate-sugar epimerase